MPMRSEELMLPDSRKDFWENEHILESQNHISQIRRRYTNYTSQPTYRPQAGSIYLVRRLAPYLCTKVWGGWCEFVKSLKTVNWIETASIMVNWTSENEHWKTFETWNSVVMMAALVIQRSGGFLERVFPPMSTVQPLDLPTLAILVSQLLLESDQLIFMSSKDCMVQAWRGEMKCTTLPYYYATTVLHIIMQPTALMHIQPTPVWTWFAQPAHMACFRMREKDIEWHLEDMGKNSVTDQPISFVVKTIRGILIGYSIPVLGAFYFFNLTWCATEKGRELAQKQLTITPSHATDPNQILELVSLIIVHLN